MKVAEIKEILKKYNNEEKEKIIIELYKRIPKRVKEDYNIDNYIINANKDVHTKKQEENISIEKLEKEIDFFLQCAYNDYYASPNKIIPKNERTKWRFKVKDFYKQLNKFPAKTEEGKKATELLIDLYKILSLGSNYLTFTSWNTFGAIQVCQSDFYSNIIERTLENGVNKENLKVCTELLNVEYDPQEYHKNILISLESSLRSTDAKYMAIELLKEQADTYIEKYKKNNKYDDEEHANYIIECIVDIYFSLCEIDEGLKYYHKKYIQSKSEIKEYIILDNLEFHELYNEWIKEYEKYEGKIEYRAELKNKYRKIKSEYGKN